MSLAAALASSPRRYAVDKCDLRRWSKTLTPEERAALWAIVQREDITIRTAAQLITANGHPLSPSTISNHRNRTCQTCERYRPWA